MGTGAADQASPGVMPVGERRPRRPRLQSEVAAFSGPPPVPPGDQPESAPPPEGPLGPDPNRQAPPPPAHIDRAVRPPRNRLEG